MAATLHRHAAGRKWEACHASSPGSSTRFVGQRRSGPGSVHVSGSQTQLVTVVMSTVKISVAVVVAGRVARVSDTVR